VYKLFYEAYASFTSQIENPSEFDINQTYFAIQYVGENSQTTLYEFKLTSSNKIALFESNFL
jgi:hypothetical protein